MGEDREGWGGYGDAWEGGTGRDGKGRGGMGREGAATWGMRSRASERNDTGGGLLRGSARRAGPWAADRPSLPLP